MRFKLQGEIISVFAFFPDAMLALLFFFFAKPCKSSSSLLINMTNKTENKN